MDGLREISGPQSRSPPHGVGPAKEGHRSRILVIDDEEMIRSLLSRMLTSKGYQVACASDGQAALHKIQDTAYDVIICNVMMPGMDGLTFYRELRRRNPDLATRVVFCTGGVTPRTRSLLLETGREVLLKPFLVEEVYRLVERVISACAKSSVQPT